MGCMGESPNHLRLSSNPTLKLTGWKTLAGTFKKTNFSRRKTLYPVATLSEPSLPGEESQALPSLKEQDKQDSPC